MKRLFPFGLPLPFYAPDDPPGGGDQGVDKSGGDQGAGDKSGGDQGDKSGAGDDKAGAGDKGADQGDKGQRGGADTALNDKGGAGDDKSKPPADAFPANWREQWATGADGKVDEKMLERLKRIPAPGDVWKSYLAADAKINSGKANADEPMPDPTKDPEGAKAWRAARDIPESPDGYELTKEQQERLIDEDKPVLASYTADMHALGMPRKYVAAGVNWYLGLQEAEAKRVNDLDKEGKATVEKAMRSKWGADYDGNNATAKRYATEAIKGVDWFTARLPDGRALGNIPEVVEALAKFGLMEYGEADFVGGERQADFTNELDELNKIMKSDIDRWNNSPDLRKRHFELTQKQHERDTRMGKAV